MEYLTNSNVFCFCFVFDFWKNVFIFKGMLSIQDRNLVVGLIIMINPFIVMEQRELGLNAKQRR